MTCGSEDHFSQKDVFFTKGDPYHHLFNILLVKSVVIGGHEVVF